MRYRISFDYLRAILFATKLTIVSGGYILYTVYVIACYIQLDR